MTTYVAKKAGTAGVDAAEFLEICVQYPTRLLRQMLTGFCNGITREELQTLGEQMCAARVADGAGEGGVLAIYKEVLECPGGIQAAVVAALRQPLIMSESSWQNRHLQEAPSQCPQRTQGSLSSAHEKGTVGLQSAQPSCKRAAPTPSDAHSDMANANTCASRSSSLSSFSSPRCFRPADSTTPRSPRSPREGPTAMAAFAAQSEAEPAPASPPSDGGGDTTVTLTGRVTHKHSTRPAAAGGGGSGGSGKAKNFAVMESSPGRADVYVPRNIFIGWDLKQWDAVMPPPPPHTRN